MTDTTNDQTVRLYDRIGQFITVPMGLVRVMAEVGVEAFGLFSYLRSVADFKTGRADPTYNDIAEGTGLNMTQIAEAIRRLIASGYLLRKKRFSAPSEYHLILPPTDGIAPPPLATEGELPRPTAGRENAGPERVEIKTRPVRPDDPPLRVRGGKSQSVPPASEFPDLPAKLPPDVWQRDEVKAVKEIMRASIPGALLDRIIDAANGKSRNEIRAVIETCALHYGTRGSGWEWIDHLKAGTLPGRENGRAGARRTPTQPRGQGNSVFLDHVSGSPTN